jgi:hypothetical protein
MLRIVIVPSLRVGVTIALALVTTTATGCSGGNKGGGGAESIRGKVTVTGSWDSIAVKSPTGAVTTIGNSRYQVSVGDWCQGTDGFGDVQPGAQVVVKNTSGQTLVWGSLEDGSISGMKGSLAENGWSCTFPFTISSVPDVDSYAVSLGNRGQILYSHDEMVAKSWTVDLSLGG